MSPPRSLFVLTAAAVSAFAHAATPISKVLDLLDRLKTEVEDEGAAEAKEYDKFACYCKNTNNGKSTAINNGKLTIDTKSSAIEDKTATKVDKEAELARRKQKHEDMTKELEDVEATFAKSKAEYEALSADQSKAISSLNNAINAMEGSKPSFLAVRETVQQGIEVAGVMNLIPDDKRRDLEAFLQTRTTVDPNDPVFKYHAQGIVDLLNKLLTDFQSEKQTTDTEWGKTKSTYTSTAKSLNTKISENSDQINTLKGTTIPTLEGEIASAREALVNAEASLKDDQLYLKDLTALCEQRANAWDQRSSLRADELKALTGAITVLRSKVEAKTAVNKRALLQVRTAAAHAAMAGVARHAAGLSLLQEVASNSGADAEMLATKAKMAKASTYLRRESERLHSSALSSVAVHLDADPFGKVKGLIQKLVERLLAESTAEATKKGFCDEELGKAKSDRDSRWEETQDLNQEIRQLELKEDELEAEIEMLTEALKKLREDLDEARETRKTESKDNHAAIKEAKAGLDGLTEAMTILKVFYKQAAKETVLLQASPVDLDPANPGAEGGANTGKQEQSKAIIGLLEVIATDFDRTVRTTTEAEQKSHEACVEFERASLSDISGKDKKKELDDEDLTTTRDALKVKFADLNNAQSLLDLALQRLEELKPTCIDTGMSYAERVAKREDEIQALNNALCILDTNGVEELCSGQEV